MMSNIHAPGPIMHTVESVVLEEVVVAPSNQTKDNHYQGVDEEG
jgi:hypothetical protein